MTRYVLFLSALVGCAYNPGTETGDPVDHNSGPGAVYGSNQENDGQPGGGGTTDDTGTDGSDDETDETGGTGTGTDTTGEVEPVTCTVTVLSVNDDIRTDVEFLELWLCDLNAGCENYYDQGHELLEDDPYETDEAQFEAALDSFSEVDLKFGGYVYFDETDLNRTQECWGSDDLLWECDHDYVVGATYAYVTLQVTCDMDDDAATEDEIFACASDGADIVCD